MNNDKIIWPLIGNKHIAGFLSRAVKGDDVSGVYIFSGPDNLGKTSTAIFFAQILLCEKKSKQSLPCNQCSSCARFIAERRDSENQEQGILHSDLYLLKKEKDKKNISIEQVRDFIKSLSMSSFLNSYKIGVIKHAHALSEGGFNALLKTLEEPREKVVVILITSDVDLLPETIVSRSKVLRFGLVDSDFIYDDLVNRFKASRSVAKNFARASMGRPALAIKFLEDKEFGDNYFYRAKSFLEILKKDINERMLLVAELVGEKSSGQETASLAERIIEIWQGVTRDLLVLGFGQKNLLQHEFMKDELENFAPKMSNANLLALMSSLGQAKKYLRANVNPKLVLENIVISI